MSTTDFEHNARAAHGHVLPALRKRTTACAITRFARKRVLHYPHVALRQGCKLRYGVHDTRCARKRVLFPSHVVITSILYRQHCTASHASCREDASSTMSTTDLNTVRVQFMTGKKS